MTEFYPPRELEKLPEAYEQNKPAKSQATQIKMLEDMLREAIWTAKRLQLRLDEFKPTPQDVCEECGGSGEVPPAKGLRKETCSVCHGSGEVPLDGDVPGPMDAKEPSLSQTRGEGFDREKLDRLLEGRELSPESQQALRKFREWLNGASKIPPEDLNLILREAGQTREDLCGECGECGECGGVGFVSAGSYPIKGGGVHQATMPCPKCTKKGGK